ncbi:YciI family protein [Chromobacterium alticapitis]|uniref:YCII-related domain-containing protein n=1 Tax=Chromobacterium alticapitis TaxID=2073169 RepID=A0A2S5DDX4_9NEIS|nr:YciI family protein [Chromobacterium alticapitis]POZ61188.1 hypothetical protein C2I19_15055 [Chromobacterium alticapitis]
MFVVSLTYTASLSDVDALLPAHVEWLKHAYADGLFLASGRKVPREGGVILARGERAALEARLAQDPFAKGGLARYDIIEFVPSMAATGLESLTEA